MSQSSNFIVRGGLDLSNFQTGMQKMQTQLGTFQSNMTKSFNTTQNNLSKVSGGISKAVGMIKAAIGTIAIGTLVKESTTAAMSVESSIAQISRIMQDNASVFNSWAQVQSSAFGMAREDAYKYGAVYGNLVSGFEKDTSKINTYTTQLLQASAVTASATGRTVDDVMERIRSGILGNTESIEDLGVYANVSMIETTNAFKELANGKSWEQLDYNTQQQIRVMSILEQVTQKYGDTLANTTVTKQNQFIATLKNIRLNIGQAFLPIYNAVLPSLNALAAKIESITSTISQFTQALFGKSVQASTSNIESQTQAVSDLGTATEDAATAAKKATMSFDELNVINSNNSTSTGDSSTTSTTTSSNPTDSSTVSNANNFADLISKIKDKVQPAIDAFENLKTAVEPFEKNVGEGLKWFYDKVLTPIAEITISDTVPSFLYMVTNAITALNTAIDKFKENKTGKTVIDFLTDLNNMQLKDTAEWFKKIGDVFGDITGFIKEPSWATFSDILGDIFEAFLNSPIVDNPITNAFEKLTGFNLQDWYANKVEPFTQKWNQFLSDLGGKAWDITLNLVSKIPTTPEEIKTTVKELIKNAGEFTIKIGTAFIQTAKDFIDKGKEILDNIKAGYEVKTEEFKSWIVQQPAAIAEWFGGLKDSFLAKGHQIFSGIKAGWEEKTEEFKAWLVELPPKIAYWFGSLVGNFITKGGQIISGIQQGWKSGVEDFKTWLQGLPGSVASWFGSLKTLFSSKGDQMMTGIQKGWGDGIEGFKDWLVGLPSNVASWFGSLKTLFVSKGGQIITGIEKGWSDGWTDFKKWLGDLPEQIASAIGSLASYGKTIMESFFSGMQSAGVKLPHFSFDGSINPVDWVTTGTLPSISVKWYANGGLPDTGDLFVANEAGPELVGRMGSQTAVANQDQIVEALANGIYGPIYNAVSSAMKQSSSGSSNVINVDGETWIRATAKGSNRYNRRQSTTLQPE